MMKLTRLWTLLSACSLLVFAASLALGGLPEKDKAAKLEKTATNDLYKPFLINNVFNYYSNNGDGSFNKFSSNDEGFEFFAGSGKTIIYEDGVVWGGYHKGVADAKVGGSTYRHGLQAGPILVNGTATTPPTAADAGSSSYRIFRVRPDINPKVEFSAVQAKLDAQEVPLIGRYESFTAQDLYNQYVQDWNEWPASLGAPYTDVNGDGQYDPTVDIPGQPGSDQTLWYVSNDLSQSRLSTITGSLPIGLEMQRTIWGYKRSGALGNTIFASTILVNKSGARIDSMFLVQWADPDLGNGNDDYAGCDTTRSLGFVYNGTPTDGVYGTAIPAGGFDFFQGPLVASPGDSAVFKLHYRKGFKNLPMSAFVFFINGNPTFQDPPLGAGGEQQWYRLMRGLVSTTGAPFIDPVTNLPTKFCLAGDPVAQTGWVDGLGGLPAGDRRICMVTGPFTMAAGDTQELVVANLAGLGADYLSSVTALKGVDDKAQAAYNSLFSLPKPPPAPAVQVAELDKQLVLSWGSPASIANTEGTVSQGFTFEGYKVYEYSDGAGTNPKLLGEWDIIDGVTTIADTVFDPTSGLFIPTVLQQGVDKGIIRSLTLTSSKETGGALINGTNYYFGVTAFSYNGNPPAAAGTHSLESPPQIIQLTPHAAAPGTRYAGKAGDTLKVTLVGAPSDGGVTPLVVDPSKTTGHQYKVSFATDADGNTTWNLTDVTLNKVVLANQSNQAGDADYAIVDGLMVKVAGPPPGMKAWSIPTGTRRFSPVGGNGLGLEGFSLSTNPNAPQDPVNGSIGMAANFPFASTTLAAAGYHDVLLKLAAVDNVALWDPKATPADANFSLSYRYLRGATGAAAKPDFVPWIVNPTAGYAYQDYIYGVPFSAWDQSTTPPTRLAVGHLENNVAGGLVDGRWWPGLTDVDNTGSSGPREWCFIFSSPYTTTPDPQFQVNFSGATVPLMWVLSCARRADAAWVAGDQFEIFSSKVNSAASTFTFTAPAVTAGDPNLAKDDVKNINVFPNPYVGFNPQETNKYARFVTFTHLPTKATIRVFNLAGVLVRTLLKNSSSSFMQWDLNNERAFPVSAGMYVVYIEMTDLGVTKTLKLGVIPEQQYLDRW